MPSLRLAALSSQTGSQRDCKLHALREGEVEIQQPTLVVPVGTLTISQVLGKIEKLADIVGTLQRSRYHGVTVDVIALPHPSGAPGTGPCPAKRSLRRHSSCCANIQAWCRSAPNVLESWLFRETKFKKSTLTVEPFAGSGYFPAEERNDLALHNE
jgi:hypothetical protein